MCLQEQLQLQAFDSASMDSKADLLRKKFRLESPTVSLSGDSMYLTRLYVPRKEVPQEEFHQSNTSQLMSMGLEPEDANINPYHDLELRADRIDPNNQKTLDSVSAALKLLTFREQYVLVQFWSPHMVQNRWLLITKDQPFGVGVIDEGLLEYRQDSELKSFTVDKDHNEEDCSPAARVYRRRLPEWTSDVTNYLQKHFPQLERAKSCNFHGYMALPVFDSTTKLCVGVLELLTTSTTYPSYAPEVKSFHDALKKVNLTSPQGLAFPALNGLNDRREKDFNEISCILKTICDIHDLPLAQTWAVSTHASFVAHENVIEKSCSSFDTGCVGKVCMSTAALPFYIKDVNMWSFRKACMARHLDKSLAFVGKVLLACGSCFCGDVTELSEDEYPLVHNARMSRLTGCFAIFLHSVEPNYDYVLEFFLPAHITARIHVQNLVQTLKQKFEIVSRFELGNTSTMQVVGQLTSSSVSMVTNVTQRFSDSVADNFMLSDSESLMSTCSTYAGEKSKRGRKRKIGSAGTPRST